VTALVLRADSRTLPLPDNSVDLIITSPPYFGLRSYTDGGEHYAGQVGAEATPTEFLDSLINCTREWMRVLKPSGSLWVNLGDKYVNGSASGGNKGNIQAAKYDDHKSIPGRVPDGFRVKSLMGLPWRYALRCVDELGLILRAEVIWSKPNGLPESVIDRVRRSHEQWFHFTLQPRYFSAVDEVREPHATPGVGGPRRIEGAAFGSSKTATADGSRHLDGNPLGKLPGSVWTVPTQPLKVPDKLGVDHFAAFPMEWPRRIILGWSPPCGVVLDPFGGTGTTALVASCLGRMGLSVDLSHDYGRLAQWRTSDPGQRAAAMQVEKPAEQIAGQADLFGGAA